MTAKLRNRYSVDDWNAADVIHSEINKSVGTNRNVSEMLGRLIETLHENHCLTDEQLLQVIGGSWEIVK